jgi:hypothetical protein
VLIPLDAVRMNLRSWGGGGQSDDE